MSAEQVGKHSVQRIDTGYWYGLSENIHPLTNLSGRVQLGQILNLLVFARRDVWQVSVAAKNAAVSAKSLLAEIDKHLGDWEGDNLPDLNAYLESWQTGALAAAAVRFEHSLKSELGVAATYQVTSKGAYDVDILTERPEKAFPDDLIKHVPLCAEDVKQAGRCLAFEVPTATAFHLHRINESVLQIYWDVTTGKARPSKPSDPDWFPSMGNFLNELSGMAGHNAELVEILKQITRLHRNPAIHPMLNLTVQEAIILFGIIVSSVSAMLDEIRTRRAASNDLIALEITKHIAAV